jgi:hypothetical protein
LHPGIVHQAAGFASSSVSTERMWPASDLDHRAVLRDAAPALYSALQVSDQGSGDETSSVTAKEEVQLLHIME